MTITDFKEIRCRRLSGNDYAKTVVVFLGRNTGSIRNAMETLFKDKNKPFYNQAEKFSLSLIPKEEFYAFASSKLAVYEWHLNQDTFFELYQLVYGVTEDVQRVLSRMFDQCRMTGTRNLSQEVFEHVVNKILSDDSTSFERQFESLTKNQKKVLSVISKHKNVPMNKVITFANSIKKTQFVKETLETLTNIGIISEFNTKGYYRFYDPFFKLWIHRKLDLIGYL